MSRAVSAETVKIDEMNRKLDVIHDVSHRQLMMHELMVRIDNNLGKLHAQLREN